MNSSSSKNSDNQKKKLFNVVMIENENNSRLENEKNFDIKRVKLIGDGSNILNLLKNYDNKIVYIIMPGSKSEQFKNFYDKNKKNIKCDCRAIIYCYQLSNWENKPYLKEKIFSKRITDRIDKVIDFIINDKSQGDDNTSDSSKSDLKINDKSQDNDKSCDSSISFISGFSYKNNESMI